MSRLWGVQGLGLGLVSDPEVPDSMLLGKPPPSIGNISYWGLIGTIEAKMESTI